jgi:[NiFe] hydrogenase assembly HybE family chaperone
MSDTRSNDSPAAALEVAFRHIADTRMVGLPFLNPALAVEAAGFRLWGGDWLGVLITPWFMNLICLPGAGRTWADDAGGGRQVRELPKGEVEFLAAREERIGPYLSCSLFSAMGGFQDMDQARAVAQAVMKELFDPAREPADPPGPKPAQVTPGRLERPVSRRGFLSALLPEKKRP